jgi:hypothetical protein
MQDNFDLKGFLRNNKLLNEGIGGYFDLIPLRESTTDWDENNVGDLADKAIDRMDDLDDKQKQALKAKVGIWITKKVGGPQKDEHFTNLLDDNNGEGSDKLGDVIIADYESDQDEEMNEAMSVGSGGDLEDDDSEGWMESLEGETIGNWKCEWQDQEGSIILDSNDKFPGVTIYATPGWEGENGIVIEAYDEEGDNIKLSRKSDNNQLVVGKASYPDFDSYAKDMQKILAKIEPKLGGNSKMNELNDLGNMEEEEDGFIQAQRDAVGKKGSQIFDKGWEYDDDDYTSSSNEFDFENFDDTDLNGPSTEMVIDDLIGEFEQLIKSQVPEELHDSARTAVKELWKDKLASWGI